MEGTEEENKGVDAWEDIEEEREEKDVDEEEEEERMKLSSS